MFPPIRILLLADTHLGFDLPLNPRVERRRRGHDFQANFEAALAPALAGEADVVVHGGDLFHRPGVHPTLAYQGLKPLVEVAEAGVPVLLVPGNHERGRIPHARFGRHPRLMIFDRPRVYDVTVRGVRVRFAGFPFERRVRRRFPALLRQTGWRPEPADGPWPSVLCLHQCVEGATVGPSDFTFTTGDDVVRADDLPRGLSAVLSGHIHRRQVLVRDLAGRALRAPVLYPGSVERTSLAEIDEPKGYMMVELDGDPADDGSRPPDLRWTFHPLPARPMRVRELDVEGRSGPAVEAALRAILRDVPANAVLRVRTVGAATESGRRALSAARLRRLAPGTMNVEVREAGARYGRAGSRLWSPLQPELRL